MELTINDARNYLAAVMETDFKDRTFHGYIGATLAGDFAVEIATFMKSLEARLAAAEHKLNDEKDAALQGVGGEETWRYWYRQFIDMQKERDELRAEVDGFKETVRSLAKTLKATIEERDDLQSQLTAAQQSAKEQFRVGMLEAASIAGSWAMVEGNVGNEEAYQTLLRLGTAIREAAKEASK